MVPVPIDDEISFAVEDDVIVDVDFRRGHHRRRTVAVERERSAPLCDGVMDALRGAGADGALTCRLGSPGATATAAATRLAAPNQRNHAQRADTQKFE